MKKTGSDDNFIEVWKSIEDIHVAWLNKLSYKIKDTSTRNCLIDGRLAF